MNPVCSNCRQAPVYGSSGLCPACTAQYAVLPANPENIDPSQPWACPYCSAANHPGQPTCWQCKKVNLGLVQAPAQDSLPTTQPAVVYWQCTCGYAFNTVSKCNNCKLNKPVTPWKCSTCGYEYNLYEACEKCKNSKVQGAHPPPTLTTAPQKKQSPQSPKKGRCCVVF